MKTYTYAVVPCHGMYNPGNHIHAVYRTNDLRKALSRAATETHDYRVEMSRYGYTSGGYRVIAWRSSAKVILGVDLDRQSSVEAK
jgi:hypothetical protein